jgi:hypothetical protein
MEKLKQNEEYNLNQLMSFNRVLNFIMGDKDKQALSSMKEYAIKKFIKSGEQFIYLKRHKTDFKDVNNFFDGLHQKFQTNEFKPFRRELRVDNKIAGWCIPLSAWQSEKSNEYPNVTTIIFDGFIKKNNEFGRYLPKETEKLLNVMDTIIRTRNNVRCFCIDQTNEIVNPYFLYFNIVPNLKQRFNVFDEIVISFYDSKETADINFTQGFLNNKTSNLQFLFNIFNDLQCFGCWYDSEDRSLLISYDFIEKSKRFIKVHSLEIKETMLGIKELGKVFSMDILLELFKQGNVNFSNKYVRDDFYKIFNSMMR